MNKSAGPIIDDAFGHALWAQYNDIDIPEIIETRDGYIWVNAANGYRYYLTPYAEWPSWEKEIIREMRGRVLDVGCGAGRHSLHAQELGHETTAIDSSWLASEVARHRGVQDARCLSLEHIFDLGPGSYDTVLLLGYNLGLLGSAARAPFLLDLLDKATSESGIIIGSTQDPTGSDERSFARDANGDPMHGHTTIRIRYCNKTTEWFDYWYASVGAIEEAIAKTRWKMRTCITEDRVVAVVLEKK